MTGHQPEYRARHLLTTSPAQQPVLAPGFSHTSISFPTSFFRPAQGSVLASDAFFPFSWNDSVEIACQAGVGAIVHPGGSVRDADAIECCNKYGVALLTTGVRHFKH